jgi:glutathione S-transferase
MVLENCKLSYFGIPGRAEAIRLALTIGKIEFTDNRIDFPSWKELKPKTPWGSLPVMTLADGTDIAQSRTILRLAGKEAGLYPVDIVAAAKVDELVDTAEDIGATVMKAGVGLEQAEKEKEREKSCSPGGPVYALLEKLDKKVGINEGPFAVGDSITIADLILYANCNNLIGGLYDGVPVTTVDAFANLTALRKAVRSHPAVKKWYDGFGPDDKIPASYGPLE